MLLFGAVSGNDEMHLRPAGKLPAALPPARRRAAHDGLKRGAAQARGYQGEETPLSSPL